MNEFKNQICREIIGVIDYLVGALNYLRSIVDKEIK